MKKYQIIMVIAAGILSFASSFGFNWFKKQKAAAAAVLPSEQTSVTSPASKETGQNAISELPSQADFAGQADAEPMGLTERQLQHLIYDIREKMRDYNTRQKELEEEAKRIDVARQGLHEDIEQLNALREKLDLSLAAIKEKEESIQKSLITIESVEQDNFQRLAATYEKMDSTQAGKIMVSMAANNQLQDVVKILYYMSERSAGKLLGEIGSARPEVAGVLSIQLKRVSESK